MKSIAIKGTKGKKLMKDSFFKRSFKFIKNKMLWLLSMWYIRLCLFVALSIPIFSILNFFFGDNQKLSLFLFALIKAIIFVFICITLVALLYQLFRFIRFLLYKYVLK
ncbi:hypothetical protein ABC382_00605 [Lysinibacillus sp. 1P01SD]|uniref:hypothetical protein n=1 Tax=Lysinibacillus sp. 1P01SD TaxID=3132285 RepID=UPI0039A310D0